MAFYTQKRAEKVGANYRLDLNATEVVVIQEALIKLLESDTLTSEDFTVALQIANAMGVKSEDETDETSRPLQTARKCNDCNAFVAFVMGNGRLMILDPIPVEKSKIQSGLVPYRKRRYLLHEMVCGANVLPMNAPSEVRVRFAYNEELFHKKSREILEEMYGKRV